MNKVNVGIATINYMLKTGRGREYAAFLYLKSRLKNGCFFNYTQTRLAEFSGMSRSSIIKYVKKFLANGWCRLHAGNLIFNGRKHFKSTGFNKPYEITPSLNITRTIRLFYHIILKHKQSQFDKLKEFGREITSPSSIKAYKWALNFGKQRSLNPAEMPEPNAKLRVSIRRLGKMFKCSATKAQYVVETLRSNKLLEIDRGTRRRIGVNSIVQRAVGDLREAGLFAASKYVYKQECNRYVIS